MGPKDKIISAAIDVFAEKGKHGARMEEIAGKAKVNKAMLYYYFTSKELLYREVLKTIFLTLSGQIFKAVKKAADEADDPVKQVQLISQGYFNAFAYNQKYTKILKAALDTAIEDVRFVIREVKESSPFFRPDMLVQIFEQGVEKKVFRDINPKQTIISIVGMNLIYFLAKPIMEIILNLKVEDDEKFLQERQKSLIDLLLYGIVRRENEK